MIHLPSKDLIKAKSPTILTVAGIIGLGVTIIFAVKDTIKAERILDDAWKDVPDEIKEERQDFMPVEKVKLCWKCYIPTAISGAATATAIITSNHIAMEQVKTMAGLYSAAQASAALYERKVEELVGHRKAEEIKGEVAKEVAKKDPPTRLNTYRITNSENLMHDDFTGVYFFMDQAEYEHRVQQFNALLNNRETYMSLSEYESHIGYPPGKYGRYLYFDRGNGIIEPRYRPEFLEDGVTICTFIEYDDPKPPADCPNMRDSRYYR